MEPNADKAFEPKAIVCENKSDDEQLILCGYSEKCKNHEICCNNYKNSATCDANINKIGANLKIPIICDNAEDPYAELEFYLDNVKREINEVFEQLQLSDGLHRSSVLDNYNKLLPERCKEINVNKIGSSNDEENVQNEKVIKTAEWANTLLKELDSLMQSDKKYIAKSDDHDVRLNKNAVKYNILKPEKHTVIPLQSFNLENSTKTFTNNVMCNETLSYNKSNKKAALNFPILKIEEDSETNAKVQIENVKAPNDCKSISKQTANPIQSDCNKKDSTYTLWTSEESILRSTLDDDNKSTSSSACEVASGVLSSGKSGNSLDSSGLDNNNESGIGTATPPKEPDQWRLQSYTQRKHFEPFTFSNLDKQTWIRTENVMTQTSPISNNVSPFKCNNSSEDPDLLEVLSLCGELSNDCDLSPDKLLDDSLISNDSSGYINGSTSDQDDTDIQLRSFQQLSSGSKNRSISSSYPRTNTKSDLPLARSNAFGSFDQKFIRRPFCLQINEQSSFRNINELPSPSSASLHSGRSNMQIKELSTKSSSAPILQKKDKTKDDFLGQILNLRYSRSQSDRCLAEIEAIEACKWLRAAGFPQYAQMYEDLQFPIDLTNVAKDHPFLENDPLQSLYRRLVALNRCATMRIDSAHKHAAVTNQKEDSEDDEYALSENWTFEQKNRRWSRVDEIGADMQANLFDKAEKNFTSRESSPDKTDSAANNIGFQTLPLTTSYTQHDTDTLPVRFRRSGSERLKDGAKAFLRRVESIKSRRRKRQNRDGVVISEPQALDLTQINQKISDLKCIEVKSTPPSPIPTSPYTSKSPNNNNNNNNNNDLKVFPEFSRFSANRLSPKHFTSHRTSQSTRTSPLHFFSTTHPNIVIDLKSGDESSSYYSDASQDSCGEGRATATIKKRPTRTRRFLQKDRKVEDIGAVSDSECHQLDFMSQSFYKESDSEKNSELKPPKLLRGRSLNLGKESTRYRSGLKSNSFRSVSSSRRKEEKDGDGKARSSTSIVRWHSFQSNERPDYFFKKCYGSRSPSNLDGMPLAAMSCGQIQVIRKLALVTLTGYMERYCPTHRSGWNWELPKFIKKIKAPDYKDKKVFGVPFLLLLQRTGETLPKSIQSALKWLKLNAMDQIGIFRKSGVKSRILKLKTYVEDSPVDTMSIYDIQQAYDVADMVKQYFRELPDMLLTAKMSETFMAIFQHLPPDVRPDAVQSAVLLLPDEHREVLQHLLEFLHNVAENSEYNQMTANNLAVCLAPSLFHGGITSMRATTASPRHRKKTVCPDPRELAEAKASHECLTYLIENCHSVFTISNEKIKRCNFGYMEESRPVPLESLGEGLQVHDWRGYLYECTSATIKEGREKSRGWVSMSSFDTNVEIAYKKVGDGHPLRLWRCTTEIEAPPNDVLQYTFKERHNWDQHLLKWRIIDHLDDRSEIFQYATGAQTVTDFCVLRSWRADLPRGACVIVETSIDHPDATLLMGGVRGVVLASRYLIEPCGSGRSKIMHLARVDIKGKTPEWYNKTYGHICSHHLARIRNAFKHIASGPESKV